MIFSLSSVYISNWKRVKLVLGCLVMEERHTGEKLADFVETLCDSWSIRSKVFFLIQESILCTIFCIQMHGLVTDTASNIEAMARALYDIIWAGCLNHILQLVINVCDEEKSEKK